MMLVCPASNNLMSAGNSNGGQLYGDWRFSSTSKGEDIVLSNNDQTATNTGGPGGIYSPQQVAIAMPCVGGIAQTGATVICETVSCAGMSFTAGETFVRGDAGVPGINKFGMTFTASNDFYWWFPLGTSGSEFIAQAYAQYDRVTLLYAGGKPSIQVYRPSTGQTWTSSPSFSCPNNKFTFFIVISIYTNQIVSVYPTDPIPCGGGIQDPGTIGPPPV